MPRDGVGPCAVPSGVCGDGDVSLCTGLPARSCSVTQHCSTLCSPRAKWEHGDTQGRDRGGGGGGSHEGVGLQQAGPPHPSPTSVYPSPTSVNPFYPGMLIPLSPPPCSALSPSPPPPPVPVVAFSRIYCMRAGDRRVPTIPPPIPLPPLTPSIPSCLPPPPFPHSKPPRASISLQAFPGKTSFAGGGLDQGPHGERSMVLGGGGRVQQQR